MKVDIQTRGFLLPEITPEHGSPELVLIPTRTLQDSGIGFSMIKQDLSSRPTKCHGIPCAAVIRPGRKRKRKNAIVSIDDTPPPAPPSCIPPSIERVTCSKTLPPAVACLPELGLLRGVQALASNCIIATNGARGHAAMSNMLPPTDGSHSSDMTLNTYPLSSRLSKHPRILACISCQQRKVKCDRKFPCAICVKSRVQCVPATPAPRRRRRMFSERALLDRLRKYEDLLCQNKILFEPLHPARREDSPNADDSDDSHEEQVKNVAPDASPSLSSEKIESGHEAKNFFHTMSQAFRDPDNDSDSSHDDLRETAVKRAWDQEVENDQHLLFGSLPRTVDLFNLHPDPVQIFRLWQVYIDNINPLLKVLHIPSLQSRVIEAASNVTDINPALEALMFSIYCTAVLSLTDGDCQTMFGFSKEDLLSKYQSGCQQALWRCGFLRTNDRDCLTALYLYLISVQPKTVPQTLSSMLGIAIRIAQRMGIHSESSLARCTAFEAEMRRRLWWPLMFFDTRMAELAGSNTVTLDPTWDCKIPLNVNDTDLRPEMKVPPATRREPTDAVFAVARSELGEYIRHTAFHLHLANPALKPIAKHFHNSLAPDSDHLVKLEEMIEDRYLRLSDQENPVHFMATWTIRLQLTKYHLLEHNLRLSTSSARRVEAQYDAATASALRMLECDTKIMTSPLTKGFIWLNQINFPFPAYYHITQDLRRRPTCEQAERAWDIMSNNWDSWFNVHFSNNSPIFQLFNRIVLQAWEAYEAASKPSGQILTTPGIVSSIRDALARITDTVQKIDMEGVDLDADLGMNAFPMSMQMPATFLEHNLPDSRGLQSDYAWMRPEMSTTTDLLGQTPLDTDMNQVNWTAYGGPPVWRNG